MTDQLPVRDCAIAETLRRWSLRYSTVGSTWVKLNPTGEGHAKGHAMSTGYHICGNPEICLLGITGKMPPLDAGVRQLVVQPRREQSRKPDRIAGNIVRLFGDRPRIELFASTKRPGWKALSNQVDKFGGTANA